MALGELHAKRLSGSACSVADLGDEARYLPKSASSDHERPFRFPKPASIDLFPRPGSTLAGHCVHELSDIREASGSSKGGTVRKAQSEPVEEGKKEDIVDSPPPGDVEPRTPPSAYATPAKGNTRPITPPRGLGSRAPSALSLPLNDVPERRSSASALGHSVAGSRSGSSQHLPGLKLHPQSAPGHTVPTRGRADSPVRRAMLKDAVSSDSFRTSPSRTFIRTSPPLGLLDEGSTRHSRVEMSLHLPAPLFVGGGTVEGQVGLVVDGGTAAKAKAKSMSISKLSLDVIGVEEVSDGRRWIFLSLATELFDEEHPPPATLVSSQITTSRSGLSWPLQPSNVVIPFCINLPLNLGPPPYQSRQASIRYLLCPRAVVKCNGKQTVIRQTWNIQMLTVHDPERALASLPNPLLATETLSLANNGETQTMKLTAGLHRQTWVNGAMIFVDVHIANNTPRTLKKIEIQIEKITLWYSHAAAGTAEKSANHLRLPKKSDNECVSTSVTRKSKEWKGVLPHSSEVRTVDIEVPRGHVTISTGRYFEVRYFLNVIVTVGIFKTIAVQLPVTLIHINSLDVLPNSVAQVAAAIEAKRARTVPVAEEKPLYPHYHPGQAFTAPRRQSLDRMRKETGHFRADDVSDLTYDLDNSPRKYRHLHNPAHGRKSTLSTVISSENIFPGHSSAVSSSHHHHLRHPSCYHCHLLFQEHARRPPTATPAGPKLPRLQVSTSGLGFSDSDFDVPPDSPPRKVMLSESERKMIHQQRELKLHRQWSQKSKRGQGGGDGNKEKMMTPSSAAVGAGPAQESGYWGSGWKNVAAATGAGPKPPDFGNWSAGGLNRKPSAKAESIMTRAAGGPARARSKTNPERFGTLSPFGTALSTGSAQGQAQVRQHRRGPRSMDRTGRSMGMGLGGAAGGVFVDGPALGQMHRSRPPPPPRSSREYSKRRSRSRDGW